MTTTTANHDSNSTAGNAPAFTHERSEFTPGPWTTHTDVFGGWRYYVKAANKTVAEAFASKLTSEGEARANARLIAAAPELLEALKDLTDLVEWYEQTTSTPAGRACMKSARAAIAKAEGRA